MIPPKWRRTKPRLRHIYPTNTPGHYVHLYGGQVILVTPGHAEQIRLYASTEAARNGAAIFALDYRPHR